MRWAEWWRRYQTWLWPATLVAVVAYRVQAFAHELSIQDRFHDIDRFLEIGGAAGVPYRDYPVEYPPLSVAVVKLLAWIAPSRPAFGVAVFALAVVCEAAIAVVLWRIWGRLAGLAFLIADSFLITLLFARLDLVSVALATTALALAVRKRPIAAGVVLTAAIGVKLWPLPLALMLWRHLESGLRRRYLLGLGVAAVAGGGWWLTLGGVDAVMQVITFRGAHGWQVESAGGALLRLWTGEPQYYEAGAHRFGNVPPGVAPALLAVALGVALWASWRSRDRLGEAWIAGVGAMLLGSTLLSPQFVVWLLPAAAIVALRRDWLLGGGMLLVALLTDWESQWYGHILNGDLSGMLVVNARNAMLLAVVVIALKRLTPSQRT